MGFDPVLDAQDWPYKLEIYETKDEYLIVNGVNWTNFKLALKMKFEDSKWLVDGAGIINISDNKRIKR